MISINAGSVRFGVSGRIFSPPFFLDTPIKRIMAPKKRMKKISSPPKISAFKWDSMVLILPMSSGSVLPAKDSDPTSDEVSCQISAGKRRRVRTPARA